MSTKTNVRYNWLRFMYWYTIIGAGVTGLMIVLVPGLVRSIVRALMPLGEQDPYVFGYMGSALSAFAVLSVFGLRSPLKFTPVLMLQLTYKVFWILGVYVPLVVSGRFEVFSTILAVVFATYVIGDLIAIPFSYLMERED